MVVILTCALPSGLTATDAYWRLNGFLDVPNRQIDGTYSVPSSALFRAFVSEDSFRAGKPYIAEQIVSFTPSTLGGDLADSAYAALKALPEFAESADA